MRSTRSILRAELLVEGDAVQRARASPRAYFLRSCSQKNLASDSRAAITFSLPAMIVLPPSLAFRLDDRAGTCWRASCRGSRSEKHFWCVLIEVIRHSAGTVEESLVEGAHQHGRPFGEAGVLGEQRRRPRSRRSLASLAQRVRLLGDERGALAGVEDHLVLLQAPSRSRRKSVTVKRLVAEEAMAARGVARLDAGDLERHDLAVEQAAGSNAAAGSSAAPRRPRAAG